MKVTFAQLVVGELRPCFHSTNAVRDGNESREREREAFNH